MEKVVLAGGPCSDLGILGKKGRKRLGFTSLDSLLSRGEGMVVSHCFRCHPTEFVTEFGDMIEFTTTENDSGGEVKNFLETIEVLLASISVYRETVLNP